jgi:putative intracellular protease/amidase
MNSGNCLLITNSNNKPGDSQIENGGWMEDLAAAYFILKDAGEYVTFASPQGGQVPLDLICRSEVSVTGYTVRFQQDAQAMYYLSQALPFNGVKAENFDLTFLSGGYGAMTDFADNQFLNQILGYFIREKKPIGLVGHAAVALTSIKANNGDPFVKGKNLTAFSNNEERLAGSNERFPYLLESKLLSLGAIYRKGINFSSYTVVDGNIITGQNPASSVETANQLLILMSRQGEIKRGSAQPIVL